MKKLALGIGIMALSAGPMLAQVAVDDVIEGVSTAWTAVLTAGVPIAAALIALALYKKVRRFF